VIETTALGAGLLAGLAIGFWRSHRDADHARQVGKVFRPRQKAAWRRAERARWRAALATLLAERG
jgi:glycerol kinase